MEDNEKKKEYLWEYQAIKKEMLRAELVYKELRMSLSITFRRRWWKS